MMIATARAAGITMPATSTRLIRKNPVSSPVSISKLRASQTMASTAVIAARRMVRTGALGGRTAALHNGSGSGDDLAGHCTSSNSASNGEPSAMTASRFAYHIRMWVDSYGQVLRL